MAEGVSQQSSNEGVLCGTDRSVFPVALSALPGLAVYAFSRPSSILIDALLEAQAKGAHGRTSARF